MLLYVAGPYSGKTEENIEAAKLVAVEAWTKGHVVICPHLNTLGFEEFDNMDYETVLAGDFKIIQRCDALLLMSNWDSSPGAIREKAYAIENEIPFYVYPDIPELHLTEVRCPMQVDGFVNAIMQIYRTHLNKNADYSPANILGTGEVGCVVRLWDKMARLMNLFGFDLKVETCKQTMIKSPKNESIDDSFLDMSCYAIIAKLLRDDKWGK